MSRPGEPCSPHCPTCARPIPEPAFDADLNIARSALYVSERARYRASLGFAASAGRSATEAVVERP